MQLTSTAHTGTKRDGTFEIGPLPPGAYYVLASPQGAFRPPSARAMASITDRDVESLTLMMSPPLTLTGSVRLEGARADSASWLQVTLVDRTQVTDTIAGSAFASLETPNFQIAEVQPGDYQLEFTFGEARPSGQGRYVREIRLNGLEVTDKVLSVPPGSASHLDIVIDARGGRLAGVLRDNEDRPTRGWVLLDTADPARRASGRFRQLAVAESDGKFLFSSLPPGEYVAIAWRSRLYLPGQELFAQLEKFGTTVRIEKEAAARQDLRVRPEIEKLLSQEQ